MPSAPRLAAVFMATKEFAEAEALCRAALQSVQTWHGPVHEDVAAALEQLAVVLTARGKARDAAEVADQRKRLMRCAPRPGMF